MQTTPSVVAMAPGFYFCQRGWLNANHFVFKGARNILIDTAYVDGLEQTLALLAELEVSPQEVDLIITTHLHCDHVGANRHIHDLSGCRIALHPVSRHAADHRNGWAAWNRYYHQGYRFFPTHDDLNHGDRLDLNGVVFEVIYTPGHAAGHVCLFAPETGWLLSADAVWDGDFGMLTTRIEGWDAPFRLRESLDILARLPIKRIFPGHGPPIDDCQAALEACRERAEAFIADPRRIGEDQFRKTLLFTLLMLGPLTRRELWARARGKSWLAEICDTYFQGRREQTMHRFLDDLLEKNVLQKQSDGRLRCMIPA
jgi:glyoxylase-like metal-dependent hydrolase (beta-lactamase superfamily II)